eukprot:TRINITY_DN2731_c0_g2_i2.p2 TRINITY_DN2731_c0_g2~~TRINITY_DN2731_c0_g2_i2.p2  ORF type:complete len:145 (-),score=22.57 TRINITY_DN2731_c0_g2_i2:211-645(-)
MSDLQKNLEQYADEWWHSESSDEERDRQEEHELTKPHTVEEDDKQLYDPELDEIDERWSNKQRCGRASDAILSCPCCFTTLCIDCQKHARIQTQYRAMFVMNCVEKQQQCQDFLDVCCGGCGLKVGAKDKDEVYHFFEVVASTA